MTSTMAQRCPTWIEQWSLRKLQGCRCCWICMDVREERTRCGRVGGSIQDGHGSSGGEKRVWRCCVLWLRATSMQTTSQASRCAMSHRLPSPPASCATTTSLRSQLYETQACPRHVSRCCCLSSPSGACRSCSSCGMRAATSSASTTSHGTCTCTMTSTQPGPSSRTSSTPRSSSRTRAPSRSSQAASLGSGRLRALAPTPRRRWRTSGWRRCAPTTTPCTAGSSGTGTTTRRSTDGTCGEE
mmetsp:Transcript_18709/g.44569  ORF Transcript_18709/g.44569 Transcript_18709/m.44569 type:complete len:242 (+) Transcript_18709:291-1016(+)